MLPHRYAFMNFEINNDYVRSIAPHGNTKTLKKCITKLAKVK